MKQIRIRGGTPLFGEVCVSGSKNAALPIIFATIACKGKHRLDNVPDIGDVDTALRIIEQLGAKIIRSGTTLYIDTIELTYREPDESLTSRIRASSYLLGAMLARFGRCRLTATGGCNFSHRPIDLHIYAARTLGASVTEDTLYAPDGLRPSVLRFPVASVGATANALIMAASADGVSEIYNYAREPHITALSSFLVSAGASIFFDDEKITVRGGSLSGGSAVMIGDMIEAGTYLAAGIITGGEVTVRGADSRELSSFVELLTALGCTVDCDTDTIRARALRGPDSVTVEAMPYPAFPTDLQPIAAPLIARLGCGMIIDRVWRERFGYLAALADFGVRYRSGDGCAEIYRSELHSARVTAPDLRGGAACLLCALAAEGESTINNAEIILRGYDSLDKKLRHIGAAVDIENFQ